MTNEDFSYDPDRPAATGQRSGMVPPDLSTTTRAAHLMVGG